MQIASRFAILSSLAVLGGACALPMTVSSHVDRTADFSTYQTYQWGPADALPIGDPRLEDDPFFRDAFEGAVERHLGRRGLQLAADGASDLSIHVHASVTERLDVAAIDHAQGYCNTADCASVATTYEAGTLVLDVVDVRTNNLVWRGWSQTNLAGVIDYRDRVAALIEESVDRMMRRFPRTLNPADLSPRP